MSATVIDSLVVELGLDPKGLTKGQQEALESFKKTKDQAVKGGKEIEEQSLKTMSAVGGVKTQFLELAGSLLGFGGLVSFATQAVHAGAAVGRLSRNIGVSVQTISRFQGLAQQFGGSAEGMASSFVSISDALEGWKIGDMKPIVADFRALGAAGGTVIDINKGVDQTLRDIAKNLKVIHDKDPAMAGYWQRRLGLDPGLFDAMIQPGDRFADLLAKITVLTDKQADAAGKLERRWNSFTGNLARASQGTILTLLGGGTGNPFETDIKDIKSVGSWIGGLFDWNAAAKPTAETAQTGTQTVTPVSAGSGAFKSQSEKEAFIRAEARKRGINEDDAVRVAKSEGFGNPIGDNNTSFGAFQLHLTPGGRGGAVGDQFKKQTGLDPSDPKNERATIQFALDNAKKVGWHDYHGAARVGMSNWQGITPGAGISAAAAAGNTTTVTQTTSITGPISITTPPGADGKQIARDFRSGVIERQKFTAQADYGQQ